MHLMELIGQEKQLYAGRRICDGQEVEVCLSYASSPQEAFGRLARRMFTARFLKKDLGNDPTREFTPEQIEAVLWESERFVIFPVVFDPTGIAMLARVRWN
jgi:hypothetical protein